MWCGTTVAPQEDPSLISIKLKKKEGVTGFIKWRTEEIKEEIERQREREGVEPVQPNLTSEPEM